MQQELFSGAFLVQPSLVRRLYDEVREGLSEFTTDPKGYLESAVKGDGIGGRRRKTLFKFGLAMGVMIYAMFFTAILVFWSLAHAKTPPSIEEEELTHWVNPADFQMQQVDMPKAKERAGGGGGGGRKTPTPPSKGQLPKFSLTPPLIAPRPEPQLKTPSLPVPETVQVDPRLQPKRDELLPTGLPTGVPGPPSAGPGEGGGMGSGSGGGMGPGDGRGVGPGRGWNMGGGDPNLGGDPNAPVSNVDTRPILIFRVEPKYTEEARRNKIQGVVRARILVGADGLVKRVVVVSGLPDGLNEQAILAAKQLRFKAATKDGRPVATWMNNVEIEFNMR